MKKEVGLEETVRFIRSGDRLVVWRLDRLDCNMQHSIQIANDLNPKATAFIVCKKISQRIKVVQTDSLCSIFLAFTEFERKLIQEYTLLNE